MASNGRITARIANPCDLPERPEAEQLGYFEQVFQRTRRAQGSAGRIVHHYALAGARIRIVFAGPALARLFTGAIAHLQVAPWDGPADATFHVWDSESTGVDMAPAPCPPSCFTWRGDIWGMTSQRARIAFHWSEYAVDLNRTATGDYVHWVRSVDSVPYWAKASPMRTLFHWLMLSRGAHLMHAAAIATDDGAVLITGQGGAGKSTTALACLAAGMRYIGDDYLVVTLDPEPQAVSLYATAKLNADQVARFPQFDALITNRAGMGAEKAVLQLYPDRQAHFQSAAPLRALLTPVFAGRPRTGFAPAPRGRLYAAASFTSMSQLPHAGRTSEAFIRRLIAAVPGYTLRLGTDLAALPGAIARVIADPHHVTTEPQTQAAVPDPSPMVSVIIPVHDGAGFLAGAVDSILRQNHKAIEIIVVDDGSTDDLPAAIRALPCDVLRLRQDCRGPAAARNLGIAHATGRFIAFLDVDDLWPADMLPTLLDEMRQGAPDVVGGHGQLFRGEPDGEIRFLGGPEETFEHYIGAALYRRDVFTTVGTFDEALQFAEDTDWYYRAADQGVQVRRLPFVTLLVRRHDANMTRGRSAVDLHSFRFIRKRMAHNLRRGSPAPDATPAAASRADPSPVAAASTASTRA